MSALAVRRLFNRQNDHPINLVLLGCGDVQDETSAVLRELHGRARQQLLSSLYGPCNRRQREQWRIPVEDVHIDLVGLLRGYSPIRGRERAAARRVDRLTIAREPLADRAQARHKFLLDFAVRHWTDIEQQV